MGEICILIVSHKQRFHEEIKRRSDMRCMTSFELKQVQQVYLEMAMDLFEMFAANDLSATLGGGSVLGAVRHHGFIPWDDDMDINMPRKDFERMKNLFDDYFHGKYVFRAPNYKQHSNYRCGKIENQNVMVRDENGFLHGLEIDVFQMENLPNSAVYRWIRGIRSEICRIIAGLVFEYECARDRKENNPPVTMVREICLCAGRLFSFRKSKEWYDVVDRVNQYHDENSRMVGIPSGRKHYFGEIYPREWVTEAVPMRFECTSFPVPKGYDTYLKKLYGDYMVIPPEEQREHHYIQGITFTNENRST